MKSFVSSSRAISFSLGILQKQRKICKHGVSFEAAAHAFLDLRSFLVDDPHSDGDRLRLIGYSEATSTILFVVHVERTTDDNAVVFRIISARRATKKERELYDEG